MVNKQSLDGNRSERIRGQERRSVSIVLVGDGEEGFLHFHRIPLLVTTVDVPNTGRLEGGMAGEKVDGQTSSRFCASVVGTGTVPRWSAMKGGSTSGNLHVHHLWRWKSQLLGGMVKESPVVISGEESVLEHLALLRPLMRTPHILKRASCARGVVQGDPTGQHFPARIEKIKVGGVLVEGDGLGAGWLPPDVVLPDPRARPPCELCCELPQSLAQHDRRNGAVALPLAVNDLSCDVVSAHPLSPVPFIWVDSCVELASSPSNQNKTDIVSPTIFIINNPMCFRS